MSTLLGTTFLTDEQVVTQGDVNFMGKTVESLVVEFDQAKYEEFLFLALRAPKWHGNTARSPQRFALKSLRRLLQKWPAQTTPFLAASPAWPASTSPMRPVRPTTMKANLAMPFLTSLLSSKLAGVP